MNTLVVIYDNYTYISTFISFDYYRFLITGLETCCNDENTDQSKHPDVCSRGRLVVTRSVRDTQDKSSHDKFPR